MGELNMYCVYKHTAPNGKVYIGITKKNPIERWANGHGYKDNKAFFNDIILYGWLNIKHEIVHSGLSEEQARGLEAKLICELQSYKKDFGYNKIAGRNYGYIEKPRDPRNKMTRAEYLEYCKTHGYKTKCIPSSRCKEVYQYDFNNRFIGKYKSIGEAARITGASRYGIRDCLKGRQKSCGGFRFEPRGLTN